MGNTDSHHGGHSNECSTASAGSVRRRHRSISPDGPAGSRSHMSLPQKPAAPIRRSRTCRVRDRNTTRRALCPVTGLTLHQKALLTRKWARMDRGTVLLLGRRVCERVFSSDPALLYHIGIEGDDQWRDSLTFRIHVQRFVTALSECMARLRDPTSASDVLRDFGSTYISRERRVPGSFFEKLANALNEAASELQEQDHMAIEKMRSLTSPAPETSQPSTATPASQTPPTLAPPSVHRTVSDRSIISEGTDATSISIDSSSQEQPTTDSDNNNVGGMCPISAAAWMCVSVFVANELKLGHDVERILQLEMHKLGLDKCCEHMRQEREAHVV